MNIWWGTGNGGANFSLESHYPPPISLIPPSILLIPPPILLTSLPYLKKHSAWIPESHSEIISSSSPAKVRFCHTKFNFLLEIFRIDLLIRLVSYLSMYLFIDLYIDLFLIWFDSNRSKTNIWWNFSIFWYILSEIIEKRDRFRVKKVECFSNETSEFTPSDFLNRRVTLAKWGVGLAK